MRTIDIIMWGVLVLFTAVLLCVGYMAFYPFKTLVVSNTTVSKDIKAGEVLLYKVDYCKYTDAPALVYRTLHAVDETTIIPFPSVATISVKGCHSVIVPLQIFATVPAGKYYLLINANFKVSAVRSIDVVFRTNDFNITQ